MLKAGGIGRYIREITEPWLTDERVEVIRFLGRPEELEPWLKNRDTRGIATIGVWRDPPYSSLAQARWPFMRKGLGWEPDVTFFPHYDVPLFSHPRPSVVTIHDLIQFNFPRGFPWWKRKAGRILLDGALNRASALVTVSEHSRKDILALCPEAEDRVRVIPNGVSAVFRPLTDEEWEGGIDRWGHLMPFVLAMGEMKPHKNLALAVEVVGAVRREWPELRLVLVGGTDSGAEDLRTSVVGREAREWILRVDAPDDEELRALYALSEAFVFPSLYEGFGMPPLEAAACGARVLATKVSAHGEILGSRAVLLPPSNPSAWITELSKGRRRSSASGSGRRSGPKEPSVFGWDSASRETLEVLAAAAQPFS
jgi:glycosyltransferase involved in cell wall biosynthesis